jgi:hypothetical protein
MLNFMNVYIEFRLIKKSIFYSYHFNGVIRSWKAVNQWSTDNTMAKRIRTKRQPMIHKTIEQNEPHWVISPNKSFFSLNVVVWT